MKVEVEEEEWIEVIPVGDSFFCCVENRAPVDRGVFPAFILLLRSSSQKHLKDCILQDQPQRPSGVFLKEHGAKAWGPLPPEPWGLQVQNRTRARLHFWPSAESFRRRRICASDVRKSGRCPRLSSPQRPNRSPPPPPPPERAPSPPPPLCHPEPGA
ncbi:hypothetical protein SKAU_G00134870 [Synaphobranchus kaupii]|uniref:Uncharacterized protein n=1 Tax=Synaphobranchus kaupii TaxID=118154 RepID=A0A9Q1J3E1_SYNKA|nr:hypothetical protein SKAU_G00134870 [Synaphobranchus kaupii]